MNSLKASLSCKICHLIYENPIKLPCGKSICKFHLHDKSEMFTCQFCKSSHVIPKQRFYPNFLMTHQINDNLHLNSNELSLKVELKVLLKELEEIIREYKASEHVIDNYFKNMETEINLHKNVDTTSLKQTICKLDKNFRLELKKCTCKMPEVDIENEFRRQVVRVNELEKLREDFKKIMKDSKENLISLIEIDLKACKFLSASGKLTMPFKLIIVYDDGSIRIKHDLETNKPSSTPLLNMNSSTNAIKYIQVSLDNTFLICQYTRCHLVILNLKNETIHKIFPIHTENFVSKSVSNNKPQQIFIYNSKNKTSWEYDYEKSFRLTYFENFDQMNLDTIKCLELFDSSFLLGGTYNSEITIWNLITKEFIRTLHTGHTKAVSCLQMLDKHRFASGSEDRCIKIWHVNSDINQIECVKTIEEFGKVSKLKLVYSLNIFISMSITIQIYDLTSYVCIKRLFTHQNSFPRDFDVFPNDNLIVGNTNQIIQVWCLKSFQPIKSLKDEKVGIRKIKIYYPYA